MYWKSTSGTLWLYWQNIAPQNIHLQCRTYILKGKKQTVQAQGFRDERFQQQTQESQRKHHHISIPSPIKPLFPWKEVCRIPYNSFKLKHKIELKTDTNYQIQILPTSPLALDFYSSGILKIYYGSSSLGSRITARLTCKWPLYLPKQELYFCQPKMFRTLVSHTLSHCENLFVKHGILLFVLKFIVFIIFLTRAINLDSSSSSLSRHAEILW